MTTIAVIGGGISGLATAYQLNKRLRGCASDYKLRLFEATGRAGGKIDATVRDGFLCEAGPNGFLDSKPSTLNLCRELGLADKLLRSEDAARRRYIYSRDRLHALPGTPLAFFRSGLLDPAGKLRIFGELWAPATAPGEDPTIAEFGRRRLGKQAADRLLNPMVSGVFAGDPERLSLGSCFPRIAELEREYRSLIRALLLLRLKRRPHSPGAGPAGPGGSLVSFADGLSLLPRTLAETLGEQLVCNAPVREIHRTARGFTLAFDPGQPQFECDIVVMAAQACDAWQALQALDGELAATLRQFVYAPVAVVGLGFKRAQLSRELDGFGFLVPGEEQRKILGSLWTSSIFAHRAPRDSVLLRTLVGGSRTPELAALPEEQLVQLARSELSSILGISAAPVFVQVFQWPRAICQYEVGHRERLARTDRRLAQQPGLFLTGNSYRGVALNDCTHNAEIIAGEIANYLGYAT